MNSNGVFPNIRATTSRPGKLSLKIEYMKPTYCQNFFNVYLLNFKDKNWLIASCCCLVWIQNFNLASSSVTIPDHNRSSCSRTFCVIRDPVHAFIPYFWKVSCTRDPVPLLSISRSRPYIPFPYNGDNFQTLSATNIKLLISESAIYSDYIKEDDNCSYNITQSLLEKQRLFKNNPQQANMKQYRIPTAINARIDAQNCTRISNMLLNTWFAFMFRSKQV